MRCRLAWCGNMRREKLQVYEIFHSVSICFSAAYFFFLTFSRKIFIIHKRWISFLHISCFSSSRLLHLALHLHHALRGDVWQLLALLFATLHLQCVDYSAHISAMAWWLNFSRFCLSLIQSDFLHSLSCCFCLFSFPGNAEVLLWTEPISTMEFPWITRA